MITAAVIARNEERHIADCLASLAWADERLVVDSFSTDRTVEIAHRFTERVYSREFRSFPSQRNAALDLARGDWVLFVDADERVTPALAEEIRSRVGIAPAEGEGEDASPPCTGGIEGGEASSPAGYWIPRRNIILGKWMQHTGWYPDHQLRLLRRERARYDEGQEVHEVPTLDGPAGYLENPLVHYNYDRLGQFLAKQDFYAGYAARTLFGEGVRPRPHNFVLQPLREFRRRYVTLQGYRDGGHGLLLSALLAYYNLVAYLRLARLWRTESHRN